MEKRRLWSNILTFLVIGLTVVFCVVSLSKPTTARNSSSQVMIDLNLVNEVRSAEELGLDYLTQPQEQLMASLLDAIYEAEEEASQMTDNIQVAFDLGTNDPIRIGSLPDEEHLTTRSGYEAVGWINPNGIPEAFTPGMLAYMFNIEGRNGGQLAMMPNSQENWLVDSSGTFLQAQRSAFFPLIVHEKWTDDVYLVPGVNANAVCRDALNGVLNRTLRPLNFTPQQPRQRMPLW